MIGTPKRTAATSLLSSHNKLHKGLGGWVAGPGSLMAPLARA